MDDNKIKASRDFTSTILAIGIMLGFFACLAILLSFEIPQSGHDVLLVMLGVLGTSMTAVMSFYFGSSVGSDKNKDLLQTMIEKTPPPPTASPEPTRIP